VDEEIKENIVADCVEEVGNIDATIGDKDAEILLLKNQLSDEKERALRARADLENFRKRKEAEVDNFRQYASEKVVTEFLTVADSLERALETSNSADLDALRNGLQLIHKQLVTTLEKLGVNHFDSISTAFDTGKHMAVSEEVVAEVAPGTVVKEFQKGYLLHDRVIRPAMVVVAK